jgi:AraC-like DNA-binding protein
VTAPFAIDPSVLSTFRTSIERVLASSGARPPSTRLRCAADIPGYWRAAERLHGEDLLLCVARELPIGTFGRTSYAFASAATIGEALAVFRRDSLRTAAGLRTALDTGTRVASLRLESTADIAPFVSVLIAVLALRCRQLVEPSVRIVKVELPCPEPRDSAPWRSLFTVRPKFDAGRGLLAIPTAQLGLRLRTADLTLRDVLGTRPRGSVADEVRAHVRAWVRQPLELGDVARALGMSSRTLQRRLDGENASFRQLALDTRIEVARELIAAGTLTIAEVAEAVGFVRVSAFSRAFSQRTGSSPSRFQAAARTNETSAR